MNIPKALYKAQQAKKKMSKIKVAGASGIVSVLVNGLSEIEEVELDINGLKELMALEDENKARDIADKISKNIKDAINNSKKNLEKEMMNSTDLDDLKGMLGL